MQLHEPVARDMFQAFSVCSQDECVCVCACAYVCMSLWPDMCLLARMLERWQCPVCDMCLCMCVGLCEPMGRAISDLLKRLKSRI
jgi:hypothetical protein